MLEVGGFGFTDSDWIEKIIQTQIQIWAKNKSIIQPKPRAILNPNPNLNPLDNTDLKSDPTREKYSIWTQIQIY
jgi:hypothetical protein